jgi:hypothetical protein
MSFGGALDSLAEQPAGHEKRFAILDQKGAFTPVKLQFIFPPNSLSFLGQIHFFEPIFYRPRGLIVTTLLVIFCTDLVRLVCKRLRNFATILHISARENEPERTRHQQATKKKKKPMRSLSGFRDLYSSHLFQLPFSGFSQGSHYTIALRCNGGVKVRLVAVLYSCGSDGYGPQAVGR